jgi:hypothetical protein
VELNLGVPLEKVLDQMVLWVKKLSRITCTSPLAGCVATTSSRKATQSWVVCRAAVWPMTSPVCGFSAAYKDSVPWR